jgi:hypothetical protein
MSSSVLSLLTILGLWLALTVLCCAGGPNFESPEPLTEPSIVVTAPMLVSEYEANEIAADRKYKGRILQVSGTVDSIAKDILDTMYVTLDSGQEFGITSVQCFFDESAASSLSQLSKGLTITVVCHCDGKFGNVLLKSCGFKSVRN